jgi:hypothetical protein
VVAVAHPHRRFFPFSEPLEQPAAFDLEVGTAVLTPISPNDFTAGEMRQELHSVAEAQHRSSDVQQFRIRRGDTLAIDGVGAARQDYPLGFPLLDPLDTARRRMDLAVHVGFAHSSGDELGVLGPEIDDQNSVVVTSH